MAVFTDVSTAVLDAWLHENYALKLTAPPQPITQGIENTNYQINCSDGKAYIFTVVEVWEATVAKFCINLANHFATTTHLVPLTVTNQQNCACTLFADKPAAVTEFVIGEQHLQPDVNSCAQLGTAIATLHQHAASFTGGITNQRGVSWRLATAATLRPQLSREDCELLEAALAAQQQVVAAKLPLAPCHCDLFRNNVLWHAGEIAGIIDFYFAGIDWLSFDLAVAGIDWCMDDQGVLDGERLTAMFSQYSNHRPLATNERKLLPQVFAVAALRFWLSRLLDLAQPRSASTLVAHNPDAFRNRLSTILASSNDFAQL